MTEDVRLVIWDLDGTFWRGTYTEGGIEYVQEHHDLVIELARRGIISSICSKNDHSAIFKVLVDHGVSEYFVAPSISWEPKGDRVANLIDMLQLRPASVLFIDDSANVRAEVATRLPNIQIEDETFIARLLDDARFRGKNDEGLTRLKQYKLLEKRKIDEMESIGDNEEFLRGCNIKVYIEYDVVPNLSRAIELINRTNQLNFTKVRLSEEGEDARQALLAEVENHFNQCGLVRVLDKYGDYGFIGFFMLSGGVIDPISGKLGQRLKHYCFSCRTLGMFVECWLYNKLGRPLIHVVGEVLSDLTRPREIDWIELVQSQDMLQSSATKISNEIRVHGGCEANAVAHYLTAYGENVSVTGNFHAGTNFVRINSASLLLSACDRVGTAFETEAAALGIPYPTLVSRYFDLAPDGTIFIFGGQLDLPGSRRYKHKQYGWELLVEPHGLEGIDLVNIEKDKLIDKIVNLKFSFEGKQSVMSVALHIHNNYETSFFGDTAYFVAVMEEFISRVPPNSKLILVADHDRVRLADNTILEAQWARHYSEQLKAVAAAYSFVAVVSFSDFVQSDNEIHVGGNHYDRMVYYRMAEGIVTVAKLLAPRAVGPLTGRR